VLLASRHGLVTVALAVVGAYLVLLLIAYRFLLQRYAGISIRQLAPELGPAIAGCLAMLAVAMPLMGVLDDDLPRLLQLTLVGAVALGVYGLVLRLAFPSAWTDVRTLLVQVLGPLARRFRFRHSAVSSPGTDDPSNATPTPGDANPGPSNATPDPSDAVPAPSDALPDPGDAIPAGTA
jgi:hypothetical protein